MRRYFYSVDDATRVGPVTFETLRSKVVAGELKAEHFVFVEGSGQWVEARDVDGLFPAVAATGQALPPSAKGVDRASRRGPSSLRRIRTSEYASTPEVGGMAVARGLYGPPEPCPIRYRAAAAIIDGAVSGLLVAMVVPVARGLAHAMAGPGMVGSRAMWMATLLGVAVAPWVYHAAMECSAWRATLGKRALAIRVVDKGGGRLSFQRALVRHVAKLASILPLCAGIAWAWLDPSLRTWHDLLTGTVVQRTPPV